MTRADKFLVVGAVALLAALVLAGVCALIWGAPYLAPLGLRILGVVLTFVMAVGLWYGALWQ